MDTCVLCECFPGSERRISRMPKMAPVHLDIPFSNSFTRGGEWFSLFPAWHFMCVLAAWWNMKHQNCYNYIVIWKKVSKQGFVLSASLQTHHTLRSCDYSVHYECWVTSEALLPRLKASSSYLLVIFWGHLYLIAINVHPISTSRNIIMWNLRIYIS